MTTIPGVFIQVHGIGILLQGASGSGKSELALELINRGHRFIADDAVCLSENSNAEIIGKSPETLQDFLAVYNIGLLNIRKLFGIKTILKQARLDLLIALNCNEYKEFDLLQGAYSEEQLLGQSLRKISLSNHGNRALATLVETIAKKEKLTKTGDDFKQDFLEKRAKVVENN